VTDSRALAERFARVRGRIEGAGGEPDRVTIVAVTKGVDAELVARARDLGHEDFGENYAVDLARKAESVGDVRWHYLGAMQRTTARRLAPVVHLWQTLASHAEGERLARARPGARVLVQVNVSGEPRKQGCTFDAAPDVVAALRALQLDVGGVMAVGPTGPPEAARAGFRRLRALADELGLAERSMGMSADLEIAVAAGATMVRVGTALFGPRPPRP
jgi:pyridoxal phosphate enzyme (YggS family)